MKALSMKSIKHIFGVTTLVTLAACGGGGGDSTNNAQPAQTQFDIAPFVGTWSLVDLKCSPNFEYNPAYFSKQNTITFSSDKVEVIQMVYTDAACSVKAGKLTEIYAVVYAAGSAPGKSTVAKINLTFTSSTTSADGGVGITLTKTPEGSHAIGSTSKGLLAVDGNSLYVGESSGMDADGYPTTLYPAVGATK
jgi:hypothetical protein